MTHETPPLTRRAWRARDEGVRPTDAANGFGLDALLSSATEPLTPVDVAAASVADEPAPTDPSVLRSASAPRPKNTTSSMQTGSGSTVTMSAAAPDPEVSADAASASETTPGTPPEPSDDKPSGTMPAAPGGRRIALGWLDEASVGHSPTMTNLDNASTPFVPVETDLLHDAPRRTLLRSGVVTPTLVTAAVAGAYAATTLLWPLHAVAPTVSEVQVQPIAAPVTTLPWPAEGGAAVSVGGIGTVASTDESMPIASIAKVVTALLVLDRMPLAPGESGPDFRMSSSDRDDYWAARDNGESALDVPVGGSLTQYEMLEGMLIGSANNYAQRLADELWPTDAVFADAARGWLDTHGITGIRIVEPTGLDDRNQAAPEALLPLAAAALANPVIAEIVDMPAVELPGAGLVENSNQLIATDPAVIGLKTGSLDEFNLLSAKDVTIGDTGVRLYASVLGQPEREDRFDVSRALYAQLEAELQLRPSVTAGTTVATVETRWGESVPVAVAEDAAVVLWNGGSGTITTTFTLGDKRDAGDRVGSLTVQGPLDSTKVDLRLTEEVEGPDAWWRLTHPLDLFGLVS